MVFVSMRLTICLHFSKPAMVAVKLKGKIINLEIKRKCFLNMVLNDPFLKN